jgi:hypothetical protein
VNNLVHDGVPSGSKPCTLWFIGVYLLVQLRDFYIDIELAPMFGQVGGGNKVESHQGYAASLSAGPA